MRLLFIIVFISLNAYTQKIDLGDISGYQNSSLDTLRQEFYIYLEDQIRTIDLNNYKKSSRSILLEEGLGASSAYLSLPTIRVQDTIYFVQSSGGMVYTIKNDTLQRIDKSFDHGMTYGVIIFKHDDTAFKYGGYGYWSNRDFFTYYDKKQDEWEVYSPIKSKVIPEGKAFYFSVKYNDRFHIFGGTTVNRHNRRQQLKNNEVWTFDFNSTSWNFHGNHEPLDKLALRIPYRDKLILVNDNHMILIDVENNKKTIYTNSPISAQVKGIRYATYASGKFYVLLGNSTGAYLNIVDELDFFGEKVNEEKFYKNQGYWLKQGGILLLFMAGLILLFWLIKKNFVNRNKIKLLDNGLRYHLKFTEFDNESMQIIKLLLNEDEVPSSSILRIVEKEQYSPAHNERIKVQKVNDINLKVATLLGIKKDVITNFKSSQDRRIRLYKITKKHFNMKGIGL